MSYLSDIYIHHECSTRSFLADLLTETTLQCSCLREIKKGHVLEKPCICTLHKTKIPNITFSSIYSEKEPPPKK